MASAEAEPQLIGASQMGWIVSKNKLEWKISRLTWCQKRIMNRLRDFTRGAPEDPNCLKCNCPGDMASLVTDWLRSLGYSVEPEPDLETTWLYIRWGDLTDSN